MKENFRKDLERLLNSYSIDNYCHTPDFILTDLVCDFLETYRVGVERREHWFDFKREVYKDHRELVPTKNDAEGAG